MSEIMKKTTENNRINVYTCSYAIARVEDGRIVVKPADEKSHQIVTIDRDEGNTPMFIDCPVCGSRATSSMYMVDQDLIPTHEWYKPTERYIQKLKKIDSGWARQTVDHCERGGLLFREITGEDNAG